MVFLFPHSHGDFQVTLFSFSALPYGSQAQLIFHVDFDTLAPAGTMPTPSAPSVEKKYLTHEGACDTWHEAWVASHDAICLSGKNGEKL